MLNERIERELQESGLCSDDIRARPLENPERATTGIPHNVLGYVIPYYDLEGKPIAFYRVKAFDFDPKYKQIKGQGNHVYIPRTFKQEAEKAGYFVITEGEKKAASATKIGVPTIGLGGVDSWKNNTIVLPPETKLGRVPGKDQISLKVTDVDFGAVESESTLAVGLQSLIDFAVDKKLTIIICFDTDGKGVKFEVQRAASTLAFELRYKGVPYLKIKQMILPELGDESTKVGLDDFIAKRGKVKLHELVKSVLETPKNFPRHPNIQDYVSKKLGKQKLYRKEAQQIALAILADLDSRGTRLRNKNSGLMYFFDDGTRILMDASLRRNPADIITDTVFQRYLWQIYGIGSSDIRPLIWLANIFTAEEPIGVVVPSKVIAIRGDVVCYQINDGQYIAVTPDASKPFILRNNGSDGVLFESGVVQPIDAKELMDECLYQLKNPMEPLWFKVLDGVRLKTRDKFPKLLGLLFYMSPWLNRWRGTQLPIEMALGEPGSGKSSLYEIRLQTLIGEPKLRNAPGDLKDWYASVASSGGLHVTDNVQMMDKQLRQRLSDEMCRLVTEPVPHVEMRRYFTNNELMQIPITCTFAITAVQQPFHNADLMQRSIIIEFDKGEDQVEYESRWSDVQLERFGGRKKWLAHHLTVLHRFLKEATLRWDNKYRAKYRLMNVEQAFVIMARILKVDETWIASYLSGAALDATRGADWAFEGICQYAEYYKQSNQKEPFTARDIADWAESEDDYKNCQQLTNVRSLGRYIQSHKQMLAVTCGMKENGKYANRECYIIADGFRGASKVKPRA